MAHFAQLDDNNVVIQVLKVDNHNCLDFFGNESETVGVAYCQSFSNTNWKQTSYNGNIRKNFAQVGFTYDQTRDAFVVVNFYPSWVLNEDTCYWSAPKPYPTDGKIYIWDESTISWVEDVNA